MARREALLFQILLMIILGLEESLCRNNLGDDGLAEAVLFFQSLFRRLGCGFLLRGVKEDCRAILLAPVWPLPVELRGIVVLPEDFEQLIVGKPGGIVIDFDGLGMPGRVSANLFVSWVGRVATDVADPGRDHSRQLAEGCFNSPETPCSKSSFSHMNDSHFKV